MTDDDLAARALALDWLAATLRQSRPLDEAMARAPAGISPRDRAFAQLLARTVLRRLGQIDAVLSRCIERPLPKGAWLAQLILRLGTAQLLFLDTPPHAAVDTAVRVAKQRIGRYQKIINAVLRRLGREGRVWVDDQDAPRLNTPDWLWESWATTYGEDTAHAIAASHLSEPPLDFSAKTECAAQLEATVLPTGTLRRTAGGRIDELPGFSAGDWWVQDAAAALPARLLGAGAGAHVIDLCAAPGGKTAQLAAAGATVTAVDRAAPRLARLKENLARLALPAEVIEADAATWQPVKPAEFVLLDAPCTATGTIRRHPDIPYLKRPADAPAAAAAQARLLDNALGMLAPGGILVYAVCSLQPEEGPAQIDRLLAGHDTIERVPVEAQEIGGLADLIDGRGDLRSLPCHLADLGGLDGFYAARLRRKT
ncbi:MAG: transcription antitermination factor NusB [Alphaproteobacteria bacterium]|jgi:16S rRNA (cytosine967-C5)-methyltransferase|nr:transcription antitermination factor NusB [Alphaproteobacteria bacterium]